MKERDGAKRVAELEPSSNLAAFLRMNWRDLLRSSVLKKGERPYGIRKFYPSANVPVCYITSVVFISKFYCPFIVACVLPVVKEFVQASRSGTICKGESVTYSCRDGAAVLQGDTNRTCKKDGSLSGQPVHCGMAKDI